MQVTNKTWSKGIQKLHYIKRKMLPSLNNPFSQKEKANIFFKCINTWHKNLLITKLIPVLGNIINKEWSQLLELIKWIFMFQTTAYNGEKT